MPKRSGTAVRLKKRQEAEARQLLRDERTPKEQLDALDKRLGVGKGAKRERARLYALMVERGEEIKRTP